MPRISFHLSLIYLITCVFGPAIGAELQPPDQLRILTYNIHHGEGTDGKLDLPRIAAVIQNARPDLVLLQEVDRNVARSGEVDQPHVISEATGMKVVFGANLDLQGGQYGNALLSKLPIVEWKNHHLPVHNAGEQRGVLSAKIAFHGRHLIVLATHLDHRRDDSERFASVQVINEMAGKQNQDPMLLGGDINATRETRVLDSLQQEWTIAGPRLPTIPSHQPVRQIDFVFYRPAESWEVVETQVIDAPIASDHLPLLTVLRYVELIAAKQRRLSARRNVLAVTDHSGESTQARTIKQWQPRLQSIRHGVETVMGSLPELPRDEPPEMKVHNAVDCGSYFRKLISYESEPDCWTPAYLCVPKKVTGDPNAAAPAVLCLHPTDATVGHKVVVGLGGRANRQYGSELAERGFVTLSPSYPLLANYQPDLDRGRWRSGSLKAVWDNLRGLDLLASLPEVHAEKFGAIGHSLGGHNAVFTAFHDPRIAVVVSSCGLDSFQDYYDGDPARWEPGQGWTQQRYMPELARYQNRLEEIPFDFHELLAALAPRHLFISAPLDDGNFRYTSVQRVTAQARTVYALHEAEERLEVVYPPCDHDFPPQVREQAYRVFSQVLQP